MCERIGNIMTQKAKIRYAMLKKWSEVQVMSAFSPPLPCASCDAGQISAATEEKMMKLSRAQSSHACWQVGQGRAKKPGARRAKLARGARPAAGGGAQPPPPPPPPARSGLACLAPRGLLGEEQGGGWPRPRGRPASRPRPARPPWSLTVQEARLL